MEAAVIDKISALASSIADTAHTVTSGRALYLPHGASLMHSEQFDDAPRFHRHHYRTERLTDFIAYTKAAAVIDSTPTAYVQPDGNGAIVVFDHGTAQAPEWGKHRASLALKETPAWKAAQMIACATRSQQQVIDWLDDWAGSITAHAADGADIEARRAKLEAKSTVVSTEGDFSRQQSALESIETSGDTDTLPAYFVLHSPLYVGTLEHSIVIRLGVREADNKPALALRIIGADRLAEITSAWIEQQLADQLGDALGGVYVGTLEIGSQ